jgi:hypothetical protein
MTSPMCTAVSWENLTLLKQLTPNTFQAISLAMFARDLKSNVVQYKVCWAEKSVLCLDLDLRGKMSPL